MENDITIKLIDYINDTCDRIHNSNKPYIEIVRKKLLSAIEHSQYKTEIENLRKYFDRIQIDPKHIKSNAFRNIEMIQNDIDVEEILNEVNMYPENWYLDQSRRKEINLHEHTYSIPLVTRGVVKGIKHWDSELLLKKDLYEYYPKTIYFVNKFCEKNQMKPGMISIVKLMAGKEIYKHADVGEYYLKRNRYHLCISGKYDFYVGDDMMTINPGNLVRIDNKIPHRAVNCDIMSRVTIIFDAEYRSFTFR